MTGPTRGGAAASGAGAGDDAPARLFSRPFAAVFAASLVFFVAGGLVLPVAPRFATGPIGADAIGFGVAMGIYSLASLLVRPGVGWSADRLGRRPLLVAGAVLTVIGLLLHLAADSLVPFVVARVVLGVGEAGFLVAALAAGGDLAPRGRTGEALSLLSLSIYLGVAIGPAAGELVLARAGFPGVWTSAAVLAAVAAGLAWVTPETRPAPDPAGGQPRRRVLHPAGIFPGFLILCGTFGMAGFLTFVPLHAVALGLDGAGPALATFGAVVILLRLVGATLPDRAGPMRVAAVALACTGAGSAAIGLLPGFGGLIAGTAVLAAGIALTMPAVLAYALTLAPPEERGSVVGTASVFLDIAFGVAPVVLAPLALAAGYPATFLVAAAVAATGAVVLAARRALRVPAAGMAA